jgi:uncharacterized lipoprotein YmbA
MSRLQMSWPAALAPMLLAACASSPAPVLLTVPTLDEPVAATPASGATALPLLAVRRVGIPEYLVSRRVRYRADPETLAEWPNTYWAERIEIGVSREFMRELRRQLPGWPMCESTCGDRAPALSLRVDIAPMDYLRSAGTLHAEVRLSLAGTGAPAQAPTVQTLAIDIPTRADTPQAQAQAIAVLLGRVAAAAAPMLRDAPR